MWIAFGAPELVGGSYLDAGSYLDVIKRRFLLIGPRNG